MFYLKTEIVAFERIGFKNRLRFASVFVAENNPKLFKKQVETQVFAVRSRNKFANFFKIDFLL